MSKYKSGIKLSDFEHLSMISSYNHNFYRGYDKDVLLCVSDDDNTTDWFLLVGKQFVYIGDSFTHEGDVFNRVVM
jgi:hypothetical protein